MTRTAVLIRQEFIVLSEQHKFLRDFKFPLRNRWYLLSSGALRSEPDNGWNRQPKHV